MSKAPIQGSMSLGDDMARYTQTIALRVWIMANLCEAELDVGTLSCRVVNLLPFLLSFDDDIRPHAMAVLTLIPRVRSLDMDQLTSIVPVYLAIASMAMPAPSDTAGPETLQPGTCGHGSPTRRTRKAAP